MSISNSEQNQPNKDVDLFDRFIMLCVVCLAYLILYINNNNCPPTWILWSCQDWKQVVYIGNLYCIYDTILTIDNIHDN